MAHNIYRYEQFKEGMRIFLRIEDIDILEFYNDFIWSNNEKNFNIPEEMKKNYLSLISDRFRDKENQSFDINILNTDKILNSMELIIKNIGRIL